MRNHVAGAGNAKQCVANGEPSACGRRQRGGIESVVKHARKTLNRGHRGRDEKLGVGFCLRPQLLRDTEHLERLVDVELCQVCGYVLADRIECGERKLVPIQWGAGAAMGLCFRRREENEHR